MQKPSRSIGNRLDIVVPCYNEDEVLPRTVKELRQLLEQLKEAGHVDAESAIVFVDDGSLDNTWDLVQHYSDQYADVVGIRLAKNAGHQNALLAGLEMSTADMALSIDADLQDDVAVIPDMIQKAQEGNDIVFGIRSDRSTDTRFKRFTAESYYRILSILGVDVIENHADFRLMRRSAINRLLRYDEANLYLRGIVPLVGHKTDAVYYSRLARQAGETKYPLHKMIALAANGITSFSAVPLRIIAVLGFVVFFISFAMGLWVLWVRLFTDSAVPGWASMVLPTFFIGGVQLLSLGVIGEYVAKVYMESKRRPRYFVETVTGREKGACHPDSVRGAETRDPR